MSINPQTQKAIEILSNLSISLISAFQNVSKQLDEQVRDANAFCGRIWSVIVFLNQHIPKKYAISGPQMPTENQISYNLNTGHWIIESPATPASANPSLLPPAQSPVRPPKKSKKSSADPDASPIPELTIEEMAHIVDTGLLTPQHIFSAINSLSVEPLPEFMTLVDEILHVFVEGGSRVYLRDQLMELTTLYMALVMESRLILKSDVQKLIGALQEVSSKVAGASFIPNLSGEVGPALLKLNTSAEGSPGIPAGSGADTVV